MDRMRGKKMRIKLAILEKEQRYLEKIVNAFQTKYADKFEIYSFTDVEIAMHHLHTAKIDVFIADESFEIDINQIPAKCGFAYLVNVAGINERKEQTAIFRFQKLDLIYKQILNIYAEKGEGIIGNYVGEGKTKVISFMSVSGGVGSSTIAAAVAVHFSLQGKKTLYLNLEKFGATDFFFETEGLNDMSDVIYAIKSRKSNLGLKLESCVKQDKTGVYFYTQPKIALDMLEFKKDEVIYLISVLRKSANYDYIVLDMDFSMDQEMLDIYHQTNEIVWVSDGTEISNTKIYRAFTALNIMEEKTEVSITNRMALIYNKFSNKSCKVIEIDGLRNIGGIPRFENANNEQILMKLAYLEIFDKLM